MLNYFKLSNGQLLVKETGARINIDNHFMRDVAAVASFTVEVAAIRAARAAKAKIAPKDHRPATRIAFVPTMPQVWYAIWPVCQLAGLEIVRDQSEADILFYFQESECADDGSLSISQEKMINGRCIDVRKSRVAEAFQEVFGYPVAIDPMTYSGLAVMKSERNGVHDGQVMPCPYMTPRAGSVYQRLVNNSTDGRIFTDLYTPVVGGMLPVVYVKQRTAATRFSNDNTRVSLSLADEQLSHEEQDLIVRFAARMGLEFGGLDVLRDEKDGRIYIVDVNKTDMGPPTALPRPEKLIAMQKIADVFRAYIDHALGQTRAT